MRTLLSSKSLLRTGLTLVELMVALAVISILTGIALPTVKNTLREHELSRAASTLQSVIEEGRARSIAMGGGGGIIIDRLGATNLFERSQSNRIRFATSLPPYAGEGDATLGTILVGYNASGNIEDDVINIRIPAGASQLLRSAQDKFQNPNKRSLINLGDIMQLGVSGQPTRIIGMSLFPNPDPNQATPTHIVVNLERIEPNVDFRRFDGKPVPFRILRSPTPAIAMPMEIPKGASIDLTASGIGRFGNEFSPFAIEGNYLTTANAPFPAAQNRAQASLADYGSIWILFGARGEVSRLLCTQRPLANGPLELLELPVLGDLHFLIGRAGDLKLAPVDQLEDNDPSPLTDEAEDGTTPILSSESIWVTIKSRNGEVVASPWVNPYDDPSRMIPPGPPNTDAMQQDRIRSVIGATRSAATESRDMGSI